ncbi:diguanylate cyclase [Sulfurospirillum sp. T05]|uniref:diguanylate cyclase n=1 Tax=Sulfurospirillum tamanense TaxID=2813362 RepID=A0ABS2WQ45_9BACT|nr:diguanylate cyclase [Sulfurospirillum tamanensis]MBN2963718.1 diguanylate cyclase [Sulfurospirillum tamanensis]
MRFSSFWKQFVQLLTFVNLSIRRKFTFFGVGTLFWFVIIGILAVGSLTFVHFRYSQVSNTALPSLRLALTLEPLMRASVEGLGEGQRDKTLANLHQMHQHVSIALMKTSDALGEGNVFEVLNRALAREDERGMALLRTLLGQLQEASEASSDPEVLRASLLKTEATLGAFLDHTNTQFALYEQQINNTIRTAINTIALAILIASALLFIFTRWLTHAFAKPISQITDQIHAIGIGEVDLGKKMQVTSADEIGALSREFNALVDTIYGVTVFKKVIEEDSSLEMVYTRLAEVFEQQAGMKACRIFDINTAKNTMRLVEPALGGEEAMLCNLEILHDACLCRAKKTGHTISSFEFEGVCRQFMGTQTHHHVCVPLVAGGRSSGVVQFVFSKAEEGDGAQIQTQLFKAQTYIKHSLSVIETKQLMNTLRESSLVDSLTGLYNRRFLQDHSTQIISGVLRRQKQIALLMCDMDYFKQVNDEHGHDVGDTLLKDTSHILQNAIRESDVVIRFGGEEFLILLVDVEANEGMEIAEKIRKKVEEASFKIPTGILKKTISVGVCEFPQDTDGFWHAIKFADVALYQAKTQGRNRCVRFTAQMWNQAGGF